jgi:hypothetical protein
VLYGQILNAFGEKKEWKRMAGKNGVERMVPGELFLIFIMTSR